MDLTLTIQKVSKMKSSVHHYHHHNFTLWICKLIMSNLYNQLRSEPNGSRPLRGQRARRRSSTLRAILLASLVGSHPTRLPSLGRALSYPTRYAQGWDRQTNTHRDKHCVLYRRLFHYRIIFYIKSNVSVYVCLSVPPLSVASRVG